MQFNSNGTNQDIVSYSRRKVGANSTSLPLEDITTYANEGVRIINTWICEATGGWSFDPYGEDNLPTITNDLTSGTARYELPDGLTAIKAVSIKLNGSDVWEKLYPRTLENIQQSESVDEYGRTNAVPMEYRLVGNVIELIPAPDYSQDDSLRLHIERDTVNFTTTDTVKTPNFDQNFHEAVAIYVALQHAKINMMENARTFEREWSNENRNYPEGYEQRIKKHYSRKFREMFPPRIVTSDTTRNYR